MVGYTRQQGPTSTGSRSEIPREKSDSSFDSCFDFCFSVELCSGRAGAGVESPYGDEEAIQWPDRGGLRGPLRADLRAVYQLWDWLPSGTARPHRLRPSLRAHDV